MAKAPKSLRFVVVTVSTSRYVKSSEGKYIKDLSGDIIENTIKNKGYEIISRLLIPDSREHIEKILDEYAGKVDVIIFSGGTGLSLTDITPDVIKSKAEREIPGFGELFRLLTYNELGPVAMLSRASAYIMKGTVIFCIPGSPNGVKLAMEKLIMPEISHIVYHVRMR